MKIAKEFKENEETRLSGNGPHPKGRFIFQVQEGTKLAMKKDIDERVKSWGYWFEFVNVAVAGDFDDAEGRKLNEYCNVAYDYGTDNATGLKFLTGLIVQTGITEALEEKWGEDLPITDEPFAADLDINLKGALVGLEIDHYKEQGKDKETGKKLVDDNGKPIMFTRHKIKSIFSVNQDVTGGSDTGGGDTRDDR